MKYRIALSMLATASFLLAQDTTSGGWKPVGGAASGQAPALQQQQYLPPGNAQQGAPPPPAPAQLNLKAGTYVTVRVNQRLSSDKNQAGDTFIATLVRPLVVDGFVVAQSGQSFGGKVAEATKANQNKGVSHLGLQLTDLMFVDGQHAPVQSELVSITGPNSFGHDPTTVNTGAAGNAPGVLLTHGKATVVDPQSVLTFKIDSDVNIATTSAPQAFRPVGPADYNQQGRPGAGYAAGPAYAGYPYYGYPYGYPYYPYYPYYWGPGVGLYFGGGWGWGPGIGFRGRFR